MVSDRIRLLRERRGLTQSELAKQLGMTRSSVNAWEQGISVPSTQYIVELAAIFKISTDYLLGVESTASINVSGLTDEDIELAHSLIERLRKKD